MRVLSYFVLLFVCAPAMAAVTITSISGASSSGLAASGTTAFIIGGTAGPTCDGFGDGHTCNSCDTANVTFDPTSCPSTPLCACNTTRIYDEGTVTVTVKKDGNSAGKIFLVKSDTSTTQPIEAVNRSEDFVEVKWSKLCEVTGATGCGTVTSSTTSLKAFADKNDDGVFTSGTDDAVDLQLKFVGVNTTDYNLFANPNSDGIGGAQGFVPYPGDEKIKFEDPEASGTYPTISGGKIKAIRVFHSDKGLDQLTGTDAHSDLPVDGDGKPTTSVVKGLTNDITYVFRIALIDEANNVMQYFPDSSTPQCLAAAAPNFTSCPWAATPEKVLGLLTDDFNCFIATAAYGTALEPKLDTFREFRFKILLQHEWGRKFVLWYYKYGSMAAQYISDKPIIRAGVRVGLYPAYWFSKGSLKFGLFKTLTFTVMLLTICVIFFYTSSRRIFGER